MRKYRAFILRSALLLTILFSFTHKVTAGTPLGFTKDGYPYQGNLDAPVVLIEYSDYLCPFCARYHASTKPELVSKFVETGELRLEFRHFPLAKLHPVAWKGHEAVVCAGEQGIEKFWEFHDTLFTRQNEWNQLSDPTHFLETVSKELALNQKNWLNCTNERLMQERVDDDITLGESFEFNGTPTFQISSSEKPGVSHTIIGARSADHFIAYIKALLAGNEPPKPPEKPKPKLPGWAKIEALKVDLNRPGFTVSGDPTYGDPEARLVIVEFTDYQCPACGRHTLDTQPVVNEKLIEAGKARWVSKQLPLPEHTNAVVAAAAAICAANQDKFIEMHHILFEKQESWAVMEMPEDTFINYAANFDLDIDLFRKCLDGREVVEHLVRSVYEATSVSRATPVFVVLDGETGRPIRGVRKPAQFVSMVENHLAKVLEDDNKTLVKIGGNE